MANDNDIEHRLSILVPEPEWRPDVTRGLVLLRAKGETKQARHSRLVWATIGALTITIVVVAFPTTRVLAARYLSACASLLGRISGDAPNLTCNAVGRRVPAPDVGARTMAGTSVTLSEFRGKTILLNFWGEDCEICDKETRWFNEFQAVYGDRNFIFLNRQVVAGDDVLSLFDRPPTLPTTLLIDKSGRVAVTHVGLCTKHEYETAIETLLNEP
jgi:thiol-disulfide isomerase/thioredoxin